jgi:hypothetical protein
MATCATWPWWRARHGVDSCNCKGSGDIPARRRVAPRAEGQGASVSRAPLFISLHIFITFHYVLYGETKRFRIELRGLPRVHGRTDP